MRSSGVLMHLSSLPGPGGIGTMGKEAQNFVDFLQAAGQSYWQLLPICPTSYGDSPYQSFSTFAGNPYFIDLELLEEEGLLQRDEYAEIDWESDPGDVNYGALYRKRYPVLRKAVERFLNKPAEDFDAFCKENAFWLDDYALFMTLKDAHGGGAWQGWTPSLKDREEKALERFAKENAGSIAFWKVLQYLFFAQWKALRAYANGKGVQIIGDLPIYVSLDSVDVWAHPELFQLDENKNPREVSGCPPDGFSADGQLWGNPLFDWERMARDGYSWWVKRIAYLCDVYNVLRIDHFRGFDSYFAIPYGDTSAKNGRWRQGPGMDLFRAVEKAVGKAPIIAEDLGFMTESVRQLLKDSGYPGMKILQFAFDRREADSVNYMPHNFPVHCVAYTGTHDNDTVMGWMENADPIDVANAKAYLGLHPEEGYNWGMMRAVWSSVAEFAVVQAQDLLGIGSEGRMNTPSSVGKNWRWRAQPGSFTPQLAARVRANMELFRRLPE